MSVLKRARLTDDLAKWLEEKAKELGYSESTVIAMALQKMKCNKNG